MLEKIGYSIVSVLNVSLRVVWQFFKILFVLIAVISICPVIIKSGVLKSPNLIVELFISPCKWVIVCFIYFGLLWLVCTVDTYITQVWTSWAYFKANFMSINVQLALCIPNFSICRFNKIQCLGFLRDCFSQFVVISMGRTSLFLCMFCHFFLEN